MQKILLQFFFGTPGRTGVSLIFFGLIFLVAVYMPEHTRVFLDWALVRLIHAFSPLIHLAIIVGCVYWVWKIIGPKSGGGAKKK